MEKSGNLSLGKLRGMPFGFSAVLLFCCAILFFFGCSSNMLEFLGDDDSNEAKIEEARMALNDEDYEKAKSILEDMSLNSNMCFQHICYYSHCLSHILHCSFLCRMC